MMDYSDQFLRNPLLVLQTIARESGCDHLTDRAVKLISGLSEHDYNKVPLINNVQSDLISNGSLVRCRGMVQDQFDPEFYLKRFTSINEDTGEQQDCQCGMYQDVTNLQPGFEIDYDSSNNITGDRQTLYIVPIPGESHWVVKEGLMKNAPGRCHNEEPFTRRHIAKRTLEHVDDDDQEDMDTSNDNNQDLSCTKRTKKSSEDNGKSTTGRSIPLNNPLPEETRLPCLVKVYDANTEMYPINSLYEFIGVLSSHPALIENQSSDNELFNPSAESALERQTHCPPPSLIPRLHCIKATPLYHCHPNLPVSLIPPTTAEVFQQVDCDVAISRQNLLDLLTRVLMEDQLAAEFTLLHLISFVFGRTEVMAIGKLSINLSQCPVNSSLPKVVYKLINQLVTKSHFLPLTVSNLNSTKFIPHKDYEANRLETGLLQLSSGTHFIVDETVMNPGQLDQKGVANIAALGGVVQSQRVKYDFKYHQQDFDCDLPVMIISEGKSLIKVDCHISLRITSDPSNSSPDPLSDYSDDAIAQIRQYLVLCKLLKYNVSDAIQKHLQDDFVAKRRVDVEMTGEVFHYILNLSRLIAISHGKENLTLEHWEQAKKMYILQKQRL